MDERYSAATIDLWREEFIGAYVLAREFADLIRDGVSPVCSPNDFKKLGDAAQISRAASKQLRHEFSDFEEKREVVRDIWEYFERLKKVDEFGRRWKNREEQADNRKVKIRKARAAGNTPEENPQGNPASVVGKPEEAPELEAKTKHVMVSGKATIESLLRADDLLKKELDTASKRADIDAEKCVSEKVLLLPYHEKPDDYHPAICPSKFVTSFKTGQSTVLGRVVDAMDSVASSMSATAMTINNKSDDWLQDFFVQVAVGVSQCALTVAASFIGAVPEIVRDVDSWLTDNKISNESLLSTEVYHTIAGDEPLEMNFPVDARPEALTQLPLKVANPNIIKIRYTRAKYRAWGMNVPQVYDLIVSREYVNELCVLTNLNPLMSEADAYARIFRSASTIQHINLDRNFSSDLTSRLHLVTMHSAFVVYLLQRAEAARNKELLPALPAVSGKGLLSTGTDMVRSLWPLCLL